VETGGRGKKSPEKCKFVGMHNLLENIPGFT
jgi:hypothetical protein